jgi:hypothetical protein
MVQKEKLFLLFQKIDLQNLEKCGYKEGHHFRFQSCLPNLRLHPAVLVTLTTGALNHIPVLSSLIPLHRCSSASSPTTGRSDHFPAQPCLREHHSAPEYIGTVSTTNFPCFSGSSPALPYANHHRCHEPILVSPLSICPPQ